MGTPAEDTDQGPREKDAEEYGRDRQVWIERDAALHLERMPSPNPESEPRPTPRRRRWIRRVLTVVLRCARWLVTVPLRRLLLVLRLLGRVTGRRGGGTGH